MHLMSNFEVNWAETAKDPLPLAKNRKLTQLACVADKPPAIIISTQTRISKKSMPQRTEGCSESKIRT